MPTPVSVQDVVDELDLSMDETSSYLNRRTGEIFSWQEGWSPLEEDDEDLSDYPEWQRDAINRYRQVCDSDDWLLLPSKFEIHEWDILSRFCETVRSAGKREQLHDAIHGRGAFRHFKDTATRLGVIDDWYKFRGDALRAIAIEWLEENGIAYTLEKRDPATA
jgi:hypothetical protein